MTESLDPEFQPIAAHVAGKNKFEIQALRSRLIAEVQALESNLSACPPMDDPGLFRLKRDRVTVARRRREIAFLNGLLDAPVDRA
jgi:hypothetical protein